PPDRRTGRRPARTGFSSAPDIITGEEDTMERRQFLAGAAALASVGFATAAARAQTSDSRARIVIAGAGAAGLSLASRLRRAMPNATITIIDAKKEHHFQPGFTLGGAGVWSPAHVTERNADYMPR